MMTSGSIRRARGFTLNEAMISLTVLTSGLLALAQFQGYVHEGTRSTKTQAYAINLAQQKLEALRRQAALDYASVAEGSEQIPARSGSGTELHRYWTVQAHQAPSFKEVAVYAEWQGAEGDTRSAGVSSILTPSASYPADESRQRDFTLAEDAPQAPEPALEAIDSDSPDAMQAEAPSTCLCTLSTTDGSARPDARSSDPACSSACCESSRPSADDAPCSQDRCTFVAQCVSI